MGNRRDRLAKYGIVALAGIAVLGWIREPEKHQSSRSPVSADSSRPTEARKVFYPPPTPTVEAVTTKVPEGRLGSVHPARQTRSLAHSAPTAAGVQSPIKVHQQTSAVGKTPKPPQGSTGRHEDPQILDDATPSPGLRTEGSQNRQESERPQYSATPMPRADQHDNNHAPGQSPVIAKKERSNARSAAIILGTAAAGAAIGAAAGGGKGAAIGALSGGTGGFVYDRMHVATTLPACLGPSIITPTLHRMINKGIINDTIVHRPWRADSALPISMGAECPRTISLVTF